MKVEERHLGLFPELSADNAVENEVYGLPCSDQTIGDIECSFMPPGHGFGRCEVPQMNHSAWSIQKDEGAYDHPDLKPICTVKFP